MKTNAQALAFSAIATLLVSGFATQANAAQIYASLIPEYDRAAGTFTGTKFVQIKYQPGSALSSLFNGKTERVEFSIKGTNASGIGELIVAVNQALLKADSPAQVKNANLTYSGVARGTVDRLILSYNVQFSPEFSGFKLQQNATDQIPTDINWKGFVIDGPVLVDSPEHGRINVNHPIGLLEVTFPEFAGKLLRSGAEEIMTEPILDFRELSAVSMERWHVLFDPTFTQASTGGVIRSDDIGRAKVLSVYSFGDCSIREGCPEAKENDASVTIDGTPVQVHISTPQPNAQIEIAGYTSIEKAGNHEIIRVSMSPITVVQGFPIQVLLVLGSMMAAVAVFVLFKARK